MSKSNNFVGVFWTYSVACDIQDEDEGGEGMPDRVCGTSGRVQHPSDHFFDP